MINPKVLNVGHVGYTIASNRNSYLVLRYMMVNYFVVCLTAIFRGIYLCLVHEAWLQPTLRFKVLLIQ